MLSFFIDMFLTIPFLLAALTMAPIINDRFNTADNYATIQKFGAGHRAVDLRVDGHRATDPR